MYIAGATNNVNNLSMDNRCDGHAGRGFSLLSGSIAEIEILAEKLKN
jgi:hypothetical protein